MTDLKPCQFCESLKISCGGDDKAVFCRCEACGASGPDHHQSGRHWNTRAPLTPQASEALAEPKWQPIETAPMNGTEIIAVFFNDFGVGQGACTYGPWTVAWDGKKWRSSWDGCEVIDSQGDTWTDMKVPWVQPTHWMHLPPPPAKTPEQES